MKILFTMLSVLFSFTCQASNNFIDDGVYYLYWVSGEINEYRINDVISSKPVRTGNDYFFINNVSEGSNDEVYLLVRNGIVEIFYKHDEVEGGPSVGWATTKLVDNDLFVDPPTVKNFYDDTAGDTDKSIKIKVGVRFNGNNRPPKEQEIIPLQKINGTEYKVDCVNYFEENVKHNNSKPPKDDPMKDYSKKILINNNAICNRVLGKKPSDGWVLFKKIS